MKKVAVLVGLYRAADFLLAKLKNLQSQTIFNDAQIVLLNCQNLENEKNLYSDFLESNDNVQEISYLEHVSLYSTWNDGIKVTESEYVVNANVDDMWHPEYLERLTSSLDEHRDYAVAYTNCYTTAMPNQFDYSLWQHDGQLSTKPFPQGTLGPCPVWRRCLHERFGYFQDFQIISDGIMWHKWRHGGEKFLQIDDFLVLYYQNPESLERRTCPKTKMLLRNVELSQIGVNQTG